MGGFSTPFVQPITSTSVIVPQLRHSHDDQVISDSFPYVVLKTITINYSLSGDYTINFDMIAGSGTYPAYVNIRKNGVSLGAEYSSTDTAWAAKTGNLNITIIAGDKIELWGRYASGGISVGVRNFRIVFAENVTLPARTSTNS